MNVKGRLHLKGETQQITEKFSKREFVIQTEDKYPQLILLQLTQDNCPLLSDYQLGDAMDVDINIRGREWTSPKGEVKYFTSPFGEVHSLPRMFISTSIASPT